MSTRNFGPVDVNWPDRRRTEGPTDANSISNVANYKDTDSLETRLLAVGYTQAQLNAMTTNDKVFALRTADDSASI